MYPRGFLAAAQGSRYLRHGTRIQTSNHNRNLTPLNKIEAGVGGGESLLRLG